MMKTWAWEVFETAPNYRLFGPSLGNARLQTFAESVLLM